METDEEINDKRCLTDSFRGSFSLVEGPFWIRKFLQNTKKRLKVMAGRNPSPKVDRKEKLWSSELFPVVP